MWNGPNRRDKDDLWNLCVFWTTLHRWASQQRLKRALWRRLVVGKAILRAASVLSGNCTTALFACWKWRKWRAARHWIIGVPVGNWRSSSREDALAPSARKWNRCFTLAAVRNGRRAVTRQSCNGLLPLQFGEYIDWDKSFFVLPYSFKGRLGWVVSLSFRRPPLEGGAATGFSRWSQVTRSWCGNEWSRLWQEKQMPSCVIGPWCENTELDCIAKRHWAAYWQEIVRLRLRPNDTLRVFP